MKTKPDTHTPAEPDWLTQLRLDVDELLEDRELNTWVAPDKHSPDKANDPKLAKRRSGGFSWPGQDPQHARHLVHTSLLSQLRALRDGLAAGNDQPAGRSAPGSRLPAGADIANLVVDIEVGSAGLLLKALTTLGRQNELRRRDSLGLRRMVRPEPEQALRRLVELLVDVDTTTRTQITKQVHSWVLAARLSLSYAAPMMGIGWPCPYCNEMSLITRSDASGDVFCTTAGCVDAGGNPPRWPKAEWTALLTGKLNEGETA